MKAGKEGTTCLLGVARKCTVKAFIHVLVKGNQGDYPAPKKIVREGWISQRVAGNTQQNSSPVKDAL